MDSQHHPLHEENCADLVSDALQDETGLVEVRLHPQQQAVDIDYNPAAIDSADVERIALKLSPIIADRWQRCTMRLEKQGGRACEACAIKLEKQLRQLPGISHATASFIGGTLAVQYDDEVTSPANIAHHVQQMGVSVAPSAAETIPGTEEEAGPGWQRRLQEYIEPLFVLITLITMVAGLIGERNEWAPLLTSGLFVIAYITGGVFGLRAGLESLREWTIDVDLLMILAALGAAVVGEPFEGAMLLFLFSLSNVLQDFALDRTRNAIKAMMALRPSSATVIRGLQTITLPIERVQISDRILVKPGERIALDGVVVAGDSSVDQASITGESMPVHKKEGDTVFAGTINKNGSLEIGVTRLARDSTIARLIQMVEEAHSEKAETQRFIDRAEQYYAIGVILLTMLAMAIPPLFFQEAFSTAFYRAMTIMVAASPCAIVISTPATVLSAIGNGARRGVLFKGGVHVENAATIKVIAFDKTGTLTVGEPQVTDIIPLQAGLDEEELLRLATAVEAKSEHPLAVATVKAAQQRELSIPAADDFLAVTGQGVKATVNGAQLRIGSRRFLAAEGVAGVDAAMESVEILQRQGKTAVVVARGSELLGVLAYADVIREDAREIVASLHKAGVEKVVMLTGDNQVVAEHIAAQVGVDEVYAELMPEDKVTAVRDIGAKYGPVAMVGDGVNDAPALATAAIGIAMGAAGTDVALETADIVLMSDDLKNIPYVIGLSHATRRTLVQNLGFALFMILLMLGAIFFSDLALPAAVIGHEGGTVLVSLNGLRMLGYKPQLG